MAVLLFEIAQKIEFGLICLLVTEVGMYDTIVEYDAQRLWKNKLRGAVGRY